MYLMQCFKSDYFYFQIIFVPVDVKIERNGPKLLSGFNEIVFTIEAKATETETDVTKMNSFEKQFAVQLMVLFEFYKGVENKIKFDIGSLVFEADGVANFGSKPQQRNSATTHSFRLRKK